MKWSIVDWDPSERKLRQFAALSITFLNGFAAWQAKQGNGALAFTLFLVAVGLGPPALVWPRLTWPFFVGSMILTTPVRWVVSWFALAVLYYGVLTPLGVLFKLVARDPLCRRFEPERDSYWVVRSTPEVSSYLRSF